MASLTTRRSQILWALQCLMLLHSQVLCYQYKVGDLASWGIPSSANSQIYTTWPKNHKFRIGDSLFFLYPPSEDSVVQVTEQAFNTCNISDPILLMDDGNSVFNITSPGKYYFTSGVVGHCQKKQKLQISVLSSNGSDLAPSSAPDMLPATSPSYQNVFGSIPSSSPSFLTVSMPRLLVYGSAILTLFCCI